MNDDCVLCHLPIRDGEYTDYSNILDGLFHLVCVKHHIQYCQDKECTCKIIRKEYGV